MYLWNVPKIILGKNNVIFEKEDTKDGLQGDVILQDRRRKWQQ